MTKFKGTRRDFISAVGAASLLAAAAPAQAAAAKGPNTAGAVPNIIYILLDAAGYGDL